MSMKCLGYSTSPLVLKWSNVNLCGTGPWGMFGQCGFPSVRLHWINTFFTHSTAGVFTPQSWLHAFLSRSLYMHAYHPCYRYMYSKSLWRNSSTLLCSPQHLSASPLSALFTSTHLECEGCGFKCTTPPSLHHLPAQIYRAFIEITNIVALVDKSGNSLHIRLCDLSSVPALSWN